MTSQKYKIFVNSKAVYLVRNPAHVNEIITSDKHFIIQPYRSKDWNNLLNIILHDDNQSDVVIYHEDVIELKDIFFASFELIDAAGGVVINSSQEVLIIFRRGNWDLPKGKLDAGETLEQCALREVEEETGIHDVSILRPITYDGLCQEATYHVYSEKGRWILKASYWYLMETSFEGAPVPQASEDIEIAKWVSPASLSGLTPMYASIREVLQAVFKPVNQY
jgi:8-oxo-dGTP pyrophosphatase MutT (NUDIX family)